MIELIISSIALAISLIAFFGTFRKPPKPEPLPVLEYKCPCGHLINSHQLNRPYACLGLLEDYSYKPCACQRYTGPKDEFILNKELGSNYP